MSTLSEVIITYVIALLKETQITSASPDWTNIVKSVRVSGLGADFDYALQETITETVVEIAKVNPDLFGGSGTTKKKSKKIKSIKSDEAEPINPVSLIGKGATAIQNPSSLVFEAIRHLPQATLVLLAISLTPLVFEYLTRPGGVLDLRFKRIIDNEINAFLSRQTQKDTEFGIRQVIIQSKLGFTASNGVNNYNTVRGIREGGLNKERLDRFGMVDQSKGIRWPF